MDVDPLPSPSPQHMELDPIPSAPPALDAHLSDPSSSDTCDMALALSVLTQIDLPPICVNWTNAYPYLLNNFRLEDLLKSRVRTFSFIAGDARPLFRSAERLCWSVDSSLAIA